MATAHNILTDAGAYRAAYPEYGRSPLFCTCPLPGCHNLTGDARQPCPGCLEAFGPVLRAAAETCTEDEFAAQVAERDAHVKAILAERREMEAGNG